ncbi:MAG: serine/threonine protein kinase [Phycisphaerales bacterium]|nr:serine/threonine protein kinase [Phycisphaerales bacterium]
MAATAREVFEHAVGLTGAAREACLRGACGEDRALRTEVDGLLRAAERGAGFLESPTATLQAHGAAAATLAAPIREGPGTRIGPYKLLQLIGEGGFGSVFMAEQDQPVRRRVALKIIKLGMDTRQVVARFEQERQALALMDHPNIAKVLDAGATEAGRPYFVMDLCTGEPVVEYCDKNSLNIRERLGLFAQVCHAVQHAHQKGLIHRDIKPSNVLVSTQDGHPHAKVIDFGIAKATAAKLTEKTLFTEHRQMIGTPEYMSPEQAEGLLDIDTRTDVYSLGVLLYELLTGTTPFSREDLRSAAYAEIQRIIREVEPPRPSTRVSRSDATLAGVAARRHVEPRRLGTIIRGELDWIVMKALEKDRKRRYETASGLATDVRRYLSGEAVEAAPPSAVYRARKFVRRNRGAVIAASLVGAALLLGLAGTAWQARVASDRAAVALKAEGEAKAARDAERARADELKQVSDFQAGMLSQVDATAAGARLTEDVNRRFAAALEKANVPEPERAGLAEGFRASWARVNATDAAKALINTTILRPAVKAIGEQFKDQPVVDARLRQALATLYQSLGLYEEAYPLQESALATRRRLLGEEHPDTLASLNFMGLLLQYQGRLDEAEPYQREAMDTARRVLGKDAPFTLTCVNNMGGLLMDEGRLTEAEPYYREALRERRRVLGGEHESTITSIINMGQLLAAQGKLDEAERFFREGVEKSRRVLGDENQYTVTSISGLGGVLQQQGKRAEAETLVREALQKNRRALGEDHKDTITCIINMGDLLYEEGKYPDAERYFREALEKQRRVLGEDHPHTLTALSWLESVLRAQGKLAEAEPLCREMVEKSRRTRGQEHPKTLLAESQLATLLYAERKLPEAERCFREVLEKQRRVLGDEFPDTVTSIAWLGSVLNDQGKLDEAEPYFREALEKFGRVRGERDPWTVNAAANLGALLHDEGRFAEAEPYLRTALHGRSGALGEAHPATLRVLCKLGENLDVQGKHHEAIDLLAPAEGAVRGGFTGDSAWRVGEFLNILGRARVGLGFEPERFSLGEAELLEAHATLLRARGEKDPSTLACVRGLKQLYSAWDEAEPGRGYAAKAAEWSVPSEATEPD